MSPFREYAQLFTLPILATVVYFLLYYSFILIHLKVKQAAKLKAQQKIVEGAPAELYSHARNAPGVAGDLNFIRADRTVLNMLEQMPAFLCSLWLFSLFVSPLWGGLLGFAYIFGRIFYYPLYYRVRLLSLLVTYPNYAISGFYWAEQR